MKNNPVNYTGYVQPHESVSSNAPVLTLSEALEHYEYSHEGYVCSLF